MKAYPSYEWNQSHQQMLAVGGMELRDYFAAYALQPLIHDYLKDMDWEVDNPYEHFKMATKVSYTIADAMIEARKK
jgi:hypothetical protein